MILVKETIVLNAWNIVPDPITINDHDRVMIQIFDQVFTEVSIPIYGRVYENN